MVASASSAYPPVIIGAGPAGLGAAAEFVSAGIRPVVLEETHRPGGQGTRRLAPSMAGLGPTIFGTAAFAAARQREQQEDALLAKCDYRLESMVWAIHDGILSVAGNAVHEELRYDQLLIAIGATDRILAVDGWQLTGVYSLGGAQVALKHHACAIGRKIVFAGSSPLLYLAALQYARLGFTDLVVLDSTPIGQKRIAALSMARYSLKTLLDGMKYIRELQSCGVAIIHGASLRRFSGDGKVEAVTYVDENGRSHEIECDAVAFGYGLKAETQLAELAGADFHYDRHFRQWLPDIDQDGRAGKGLWLAGDSAAIGGADAAAASGRLAAMAMIAASGHAVDQHRMRRLRNKVERLRKFQTAMTRAFRWPADTAESLSDTTIICRCERVTAGEIRAAIRADVAHVEVNRIKAITRCGMGRCQGRFCGQSLQELAACTSDKSPEITGRLRAQAPFRPIAIGFSDMLDPRDMPHPQSRTCQESECSHVR